MPSVLTDASRMVALYVALNGLIMLVLSMLVVRARLKTKTLIGDGGDPAMMGPLRAHANNTEYVPLPLLMMIVAWAVGVPVWSVHAIGVPLTIGRLLHAIGLSRNTGTSPLRFLGIVFTWIAFIAGIVVCALIVLLPKPTSG